MPVFFERDKIHYTENLHYRIYQKIRTQTKTNTKLLFPRKLKEGNQFKGIETLPAYKNCRNENETNISNLF